MLAIQSTIPSEKKEVQKGISIEPLLSGDKESPFNQIEWEKRKASITDDKGNVIFSQDNVEVPKSWSTLATNIVASKYFYGEPNSSEREFSVRQLIHRVTRTIADWGVEDGYFSSSKSAENFYRELSHICLHQYGSFNSPVWFNVGLFQVYGHKAPSRVAYSWNETEQTIAQIEDTYKSPQASACFIQSVKDTMEDIMDLARSEAMLFKHGSGSGTDLSTLRSSHEKLSGGGKPSGPLSFMRVFDQVAAVIKSGGKTRRAAKMQSLKVHHPDIIDFIECKTKEEKKAWALIEQGYDASLQGEAYESVMFQNSNLSVRVTDEFMHAVEKDLSWQTKAVLSGKPVETMRARDVLKKIAQGTHLCGDPGVQYDTTINRWHTCLNSGRINASNPCSEFMFIDNSACNLASINLMQFADKKGSFDLARFKHVVQMFIIAQDILVDRGSYPTAEIAQNSHDFRPLGLGYANLGALIMKMGMPYDSDKGRTFASAITSLLSGYAYQMSQELAQIKGSFAGFKKNQNAMLRVISMHQQANDDIQSNGQDTLLTESKRVWKEIVKTAPNTGFRNSQVTVLAPTGTIGFIMDCDTTGVEPDIALVKYKQLAGGGMIKIVNRTLYSALIHLGYSPSEIKAIEKFVDEKDTIEGAPFVKEEHLPVFDCAFKPKNGNRFIPYKAHLKMMAAVQPFLSGAISKTVNMPNEATVEEIMQTYIDGWKMGLKAVAIYRDGSKKIQALNVNKSAGGPKTSQKPFRKRMPITRQSITHKFEIAGHEGYLTVGTYEDGSPGELFITMAKEGSTVGGTMDAFGTAISLCLQYGVPLKELCTKFSHSRFEPSGFTKNPDIPIAKSIVDYIFRWLEITFPGGKAVFRSVAGGVTKGPETNGSRIDTQFNHFMEDAPACDNCGSITVRNGACYRCYNCGNSMGCS